MSQENNTGAFKPKKFLGGHRLKRAEKEVITQVLMNGLIDEEAVLLYSLDGLYWYLATYSELDGPLTEAVHDEDIKTHESLASLAEWLKSHTPDYTQHMPPTDDIVVAETYADDDGDWVLSINDYALAAAVGHRGKILG